MKKWIFEMLGAVVAILLFLYVITVFQSCKTPKPIVDTTTQNNTIVSERYDSAHSIEGDSATLKALFRCDSLGNVYLDNLTTEQGKRINLEMNIQSLQIALDSTRNALASARAKGKESGNTTPAPPTNQPMFVEIDCKEDSFMVVIRGLRERIAVYEEKERKEQIPVREVSDYHKNCARGFWTLLIANALIIAFKIWRNKSKIASWAINIIAKFKLLK